ncbi:hypothetical protein ElyMa_004053800 [Elysia marginata]|uniref:Uncharacterized protein n=1 Tax=Elysia marginata TaxID=1093978 RepID=A0AAV4G4X3_9GAST|nr:hypothetical protein ElyMa_004053800 [Elysia marginata]
MGTRIEHKIIIVLACEQFTSKREFSNTNDNLRSDFIPNTVFIKHCENLLYHFYSYSLLIPSRPCRAGLGGLERSATSRETESLFIEVKGEEKKKKKKKKNNNNNNNNNKTTTTTTISS